MGKGKERNSRLKMYEIVIHKKFIRKLREMERPSLDKIANLMEILKTDPIPWKNFDIRKIQGEKDMYRVRIGKYRLIYFVDKNTKMIHILKIETREKAYR